MLKTGCIYKLIQTWRLNQNQQGRNTREIEPGKHRHGYSTSITTPSALSWISSLPILYPFLYPKQRICNVQHTGGMDIYGIPLQFYYSLSFLPFSPNHVHPVFSIYLYHGPRTVSPSWYASLSFRGERLSDRYNIYIYEHILIIYMNEPAQYTVNGSREGVFCSFSFLARIFPRISFSKIFEFLLIASLPRLLTPSSTIIIEQY